MSIFNKKKPTNEIVEETNTTISYKDYAREDMINIINNNIWIVDDEHPHGKTLESPKDDELIDYIIGKIKENDPTDDTIKTVVISAADEYYKSLQKTETEEKEKNMAEETKKEPKAKKDWKAIGKKVAKIAIPVTAGIAVGVVGTELAIRKPWKKSSKRPSAPAAAKKPAAKKPVAKKPAAPATK